MNQAKKDFPLPIETLRKQKGFPSKSKFAAFAGLNTAMISRIENGEAGKVGADVIDKLAKALSETPEYIRTCIDRQYAYLRIEGQAQAECEFWLSKSKWKELSEDERYKLSFAWRRDCLYLTDAELEVRKAEAQASGGNYLRGLEAVTIEKMNPYTKLVEEVRAYRGVTQAELAARCGLSLQTIRDIEQGRADPQEKTIRILNNVFGQHESHAVRSAILAARYSAEDRAEKRSREQNLERVRNYKENNT